MAATAHSCILCDSLNANMDRYVATFFHLYEHDAEFRAKLEASKGFCLPDAALLLERGTEFLPAKLVSPFVELIARLTRDNLARTESMIDAARQSIVDSTQRRMQHERVRMESLSARIPMMFSLVKNKEEARVDML